MQNNEVLFHGEVKVTKGTIPAGAKKIEKFTADKYHIVAPSETTGNHHVVEVVPSMELYEKDGVFFLKTEEETKIECLIKERHDEIVLPAGIYEIGSQVEYDPFSKRLEKVRD
jgi:hypothetical protein